MNPSLSVLPEQFIVFDLETTGLNAERHEIIEIGAIKANRNSDLHQTFQSFVIPNGRISARITELTGINRTMVQKDGLPLQQALEEFKEFVGDLPMIAYNAEFDEAFVRAACFRTSTEPMSNAIYCALKMARRAWPNRKSYRLVDLARDGGLAIDDAHRALGDCHRALLIYVAAAKELGSYR